jgi:chemotaxis protein MotB
MPAPGKEGKKIVVVRKKKVVAGGHHGGSWKVAYADFVTAMMAFFMVMWILGMDENVKQAVEGYFSNPVGYKKGFGAGASPIASGASPARAAAGCRCGCSCVPRRHAGSPTSRARCSGR